RLRAADERTGGYALRHHRRSAGRISRRRRLRAGLYEPDLCDGQAAGCPDAARARPLPLSALRDVAAMTHLRLRKFNTRDTYPDQSLDNDLCQVVVARGRLVFVRGQVGQNLETAESACIGDPAGQADQAMRNVA